MDGFTVEPSATAVADAPPAANPTVALPIATIAWFLALLIILFFPVLKPMVYEWMTDENMGHAFFVPIVSGYIIWCERTRILAQPVKPCWPAILLVIWGFCQMILGFVGADFFVARAAFLIAGVGIIWTLAGTAVLKSMAFPLFLLVFMLRIPLFLYQQMTFPLQLFASAVAEGALDLIGIPVLREGNVLELPSQKLAVIEACSGIRSILSLAFLSFAYAYIFDHRKWMRLALFLAAIPAAIGANSFRIVITGIFSEYKREWTEGVYHSLEGWVIFMVAVTALVAAHRLICRFAGPSHA
jgi:exosortase